MRRNILTEYRLELVVILLLLCGFASVIGVIGVLLGPALPGSWGIFQDLIDPLGGWIYWLVLLGLIGLAFSTWWLLDFIFKAKKLRKMIETMSKAKFIKNMDEIEYIAWRLPGKYKMLVARKKSELRIRK